jgi:protein TonB
VSRYPEKAKQMGVEGKVVVSAWIDENDEVTDIQIVRGIMNECDNEVIRGLQLIEKGWIAGRLKGQPVRSQIMLIFEFNLNNSTKIMVSM